MIICGFGLGFGYLAATVVENFRKPIPWYIGVSANTPLSLPKTPSPSQTQKLKHSQRHRHQTTPVVRRIRHFR
jgi:hypothetical protein